MIMEVKYILEKTYNDGYTWEEVSEFDTLEAAKASQAMADIKQYQVTWRIAKVTWEVVSIGYGEFGK